MLEFKPITIDDKELFEKYTLCHGYHNLEASFANIYIWRRAWNIQIAVDDLAMYLYLNNQNTSFMLPPFPDNCDKSLEEVLLRCEAFMQSRDERFMLRGVMSAVKEKIERDCPGRYTLTADRNNFEYVYNAKDLCTLEGKKYHSKRNHINKLTASHSCEYRRYTKDDYESCMGLYKQWAEEKGGLTESYKNEMLALKDALLNLEHLKLVCGLLIVDGNMEAFSIGEKFGDDMAIIHFEKANPNLQGTYAMINREFVRNEWCELEYINREEDMGIEGLRKAKLSYYPVFMNEKFVGVKGE